MKKGKQGNQETDRPVTMRGAFLVTFIFTFLYTALVYIVQLSWLDASAVFITIVIVLEGISRFVGERTFFQYLAVIVRW